MLNFALRLVRGCSVGVRIVVVHLLVLHCGFRLSSHYVMLLWLELGSCGVYEVVNIVCEPEPDSPLLARV